MYRRMALIAGAIVTAVTLVVAAPALALGTLNQSISGQSNAYSGVTSSQSVAQTFWANSSGLLDRVTLELSKNGTPGAFTVAVFALANGLPTGSALASETIAESTVTTSRSTVIVDFSAPASVTSGSSYALVMQAPSAGGLSGAYKWHDVGYDLVPNLTELINTGSGWNVANNDAYFATYVTYVQPSSTPSASSSGSSSAGSSSASATVAAAADTAPTLASTGADLLPLALSALAAFGVGALALRRRASSSR